MKVTKGAVISFFNSCHDIAIFWCPRLMQAFELEILKLGPSLLITILGILAWMEGENGGGDTMGGIHFQSRVFSGGEREKLESFVQ